MVVILWAFWSFIYWHIDIDIDNDIDIDIGVIESPIMSSKVNIESILVF